MGATERTTLKQHKDKEPNTLPVVKETKKGNELVYRPIGEVRHGKKKIKNIFKEYDDRILYLEEDNKRLRKRLDKMTDVLEKLILKAKEDIEGDVL